MNYEDFLRAFIYEVGAKVAKAEQAQEQFGSLLSELEKRTLPLKDFYIKELIEEGQLPNSVLDNYRMTILLDKILSPSHCNRNPLCQDTLKPYPKLTSRFLISQNYYYQW